MVYSSFIIRATLLYEFKNQLTAADAARRIRNAFGEDAVSDGVARFWFRRFKGGNECIEDEQRKGPPETCSNDEIKQYLGENPRATCSEIGQALDCDESTIRKRLHAINFIKKLDKWIPHKLSDGNKIMRLTIANCQLPIANSLLARNANDPFIDRIVTCDEKWVDYDNSRRSGQWVEVGKPGGTIPKKSLTPRKILITITVWWTARGIVHIDYLPRGQTINSTVYCSQIDIVHQKLLQRRASLVNRKGVLLLHDNARPHVSLETQRKLQSVKWEVLPHPPYSPDISPCDYYLFLSLSNFLCDKRFNSEEEVKTEVDLFFSSKNPNFYSRGMNLLVERWQKIVDSNGDYFVE